MFLTDCNQSAFPKYRMVHISVKLFPINGNIQIQTCRSISRTITGRRLSSGLNMEDLISGKKLCTFSK